MIYHEYLMFSLPSGSKAIIRTFFSYVDSDKACLYARNDDELSIRAQYSFNPSVILRCHSSRLIGAESKAERRARYELKLFCFRNHFIILINFMTSFSRSLASSCSKIFVLNLIKIVPKY